MKILVRFILPALFIVVCVVIYLEFFHNSKKMETYEVEKTEYNRPQAAAEDVLVDDSLEDKKTSFDPELIGGPIGTRTDWLINNSAAVFRLDVPVVKPDREVELLILHPSYKAAIDRTSEDYEFLPSVNAVDGKAKQFDDGLYAVLDQAYYKGLEGTLLSHVELVKRIFEKVGKDSPAAPFLAAGLELAGVKVPVSNEAAKAKLLADFNANQTESKPIGFYTWNETLSQCFRFLVYFQRHLVKEELALIRDITAAVSKDPALLADYKKAMNFYAKLTNPYNCLSVVDLAGQADLDWPSVERLAGEKKVRWKVVALFPPSTSKETVLFWTLFPQGLPPNADLMRELVRAIRSGKVDLKPKPGSGWYEHQVYALETLLLPEKGEEHNKLLLTKEYKKRMLEAFQAQMTKRRETHVRQLSKDKKDGPGGSYEPPPPPDSIRPRLRIEPCPSYFLRTARAYAFLANFLETAIGKEALQRLHGLKQDGERKPNLHAELADMRDLFYGLYFISAEDIGLKPELAPDETVDRERCTELAVDWLPKAFDDPELAVDTRVSVPIYVDRINGVTRLWLKLGVRMTKLEASYARPPHIKPVNGAVDWAPVERGLEPSKYLIPVDEFAEVELKGLRSLTREELRAVCDREKTKEAIIRALRQ
jgi:hypothetical protein